MNTTTELLKVVGAHHRAFLILAGMEGLTEKERDDVVAIIREANKTVEQPE
jgi:hypothetical protein